MSLVRDIGNGKVQINTDEAFCELLNGVMPPDNKPIDELLSEFDAEIRRNHPSVKQEALNNVHGTWYEWLVAITAWNEYIAGNCLDLALMLPNVSQFDVMRLQTAELYEHIEDLRQKLSEKADVELKSSNPDFVIISGDLASDILASPAAISSLTTSVLQEIQSKYSAFEGRCEFEDIEGYVSIKTTFRPDRRYQIVHEGSLMKALYVHLQSRQWIFDPKGLNYYAMATKVGDKDIEALKTIATHSITSVSTMPESAVDGVFEVNSLAAAKEVLADILS